MLLSRRSMLTIGAALGLAGLPWPALAQQRRIRRSIFELSGRDDDLAAFVEGIAIMRSRTDLWSLRSQAELHSQYGQHNGWLFFPWHRVDLVYFESIIARLTGHSGFALPYWDYQRTGFLPTYFHDPNHPLHHPGRSPASTNYARARWAMNQRFADLLRDSFDSFVGGAAYAGRVEAYGHNQVHGLIGGDMGDLGRAPFDPAFYLHHCNVDRVWLTWQTRNREAPPDWLDQRLDGFLSPDGSLASATVANVADPASLPYQYDSLYERPSFNVPDPPAPPQGKSRLEIARERVYRGSAARRSGSRDLEVRLPPALLAALRADRGNLLKIEGAGTVGYEPGDLAGKIVRVEARAAAGEPVRPVPVTASAALLGRSGPAHRGHGRAIAHRFELGDNIRNLIGRSRGPVVLASSTEPLAGGADPSPPRAASLDFELKLTTSRWV